MNLINETLNKSMAALDPEIKILDINDIPERWKTYLTKID